MPSKSPRSNRNLFSKENCPYRPHWLDHQPLRFRSLRKASSIRQTRNGYRAVSNRATTWLFPLLSAAAEQWYFAGPSSIPKPTTPTSVARRSNAAICRYASPPPFNQGNLRQSSRSENNRHSFVSSLHNRQAKSPCPQHGHLSSKPPCVVLLSARFWQLSHHLAAPRPRSAWWAPALSAQHDSSGPASLLPRHTWALETVACTVLFIAPAAEKCLAWRPGGPTQTQPTEMLFLQWICSSWKRAPWVHSRRRSPL